MNSRGFSLIEMIVAVGIGVIIMGAMATMVVNTQRSMKWTELKMAQISVLNDILQQSTNSTFCKQAVSKEPVKFDAAQAANQKAGLPLNWMLSDGTVLKDPGVNKTQSLSNYSNLKLKKIAFVAAVDAGGNPVRSALPGGNTLYQGQLILDAAGDVGAGLQSLARKVSTTLYLTVSASGDIEDCSNSQIATVQNVCESFNGTFDTATGKCTGAALAGSGGGGAPGSCPCGVCGSTRAIRCPPCGNPSCGGMRYPGIQSCTRSGWVTIQAAGCIGANGVYTTYDPNNGGGR